MHVPSRLLLNAFFFPYNTFLVSWTTFCKGLVSPRRIPEKKNKKKRKSKMRSPSLLGLGFRPYNREELSCSVSNRCNRFHLYLPTFLVHISIQVVFGLFVVGLCAFCWVKNQCLGFLIKNRTGGCYCCSCFLCTQMGGRDGREWKRRSWRSHC